MSPAYDLVNTRIHVNDPELTLKNRLFEDDYLTESFSANGFYAFDDFHEFGLRIGLLEARVRRILTDFSNHSEEVESLIHRSFLNSQTKDIYKSTYLRKLKSLSYSFMKLTS